MTTIVIACGKSKASVPRRAKDLYTGSLFRAARAAAETVTSDGGEWLILSAKYGLVHPETVIAPYEKTLRNRSDVWTLARLLRSQPMPDSVEAWCPARYCEALSRAGCVISTRPLAGLGMGYQMQWFKGQVSNKEGAQR